MLRFLKTIPGIEKSYVFLGRFGKE